jgi:transcriptional regulator with XRE-family HTH domain
MTEMFSEFPYSRLAARAGRGGDIVIGGPLNTFGPAISMARVKNGMTLKDLSLGIGCSSAYLSDVESGERSPFNKHMLRRACNILGLDYETMAQKAIDTCTVKAKWKYFGHD